MSIRDLESYNGDIGIIYSPDKVTGGEYKTNAGGPIFKYNFTDIAVDNVV